MMNFNVYESHEVDIESNPIEQFSIQLNNLNSEQFDKLYPLIMELYMEQFTIDIDTNNTNNTNQETE